jgi:hypothetical protein
MSSQSGVRISRSTVDGRPGVRVLSLLSVLGHETLELSVKAAYRAKKNAVMCAECGEQVFLYMLGDEIQILEQSSRSVLKQHLHTTDLPELPDHAID